MTFKDSQAAQSGEIAIAKARQTTLCYSIIFLAILFLFYGGLYTVWMVKPALYHQVMNVLSVGPGDSPFADTRTWLTWLECRARGFDVLVDNSCDPFSAALTYSPVFLDLPTWFRIKDAQPLGLAQTGAFLLTLPFLLRPSTIYELCTTCFAAVSTSVVFAVERANMDVLIFTLIAVAVLLRRSCAALRYCPYAIFIAGGMLKFYPLVLLSTSLRERRRAFLAITAVSAAIIIGVAFVHWTDLGKVLRSQWPYIIWGDTFGARELPIGLAYFFPNIKLAPLAGIEIVSVAFLYSVFRMSISLRKEEPAFHWDDVQSEFLIFGSILIVGCFFAGPNAGYRSIFLLFLLPSLRETAKRVFRPWLRGVLSVTQIAIFLLLWKDSLRHAVEVLFRPTGKEQGLAELPYLLFFVLRELNWWFVVAVASAIAALFFSRSQTLRRTLSLLHRPPKLVT